MSKIILDFCGNHMGSREVLTQMLMQAAVIKPDFVKFQAYDTSSLNPEWGKLLSYYLSRQHTDPDYEYILETCKEQELTPMFTAFHESILEKLSRYGVEHVKIASPDAGKLAFVEKALFIFQNVYISCGMLRNEEFWRLVDMIKEGKYTNAKLFYCVSRYPAYDIDFDEMKKYNGFSDHTLGIKAAKRAIDNGIEYIERHFTLGKFLPGTDHVFSSTPDEMKELIEYNAHIAKIDKYKRRFL